MDGKLDMSKQRAPSAQQVDRILCCIKRSTISRAREVILLLYSGETSPGVLHPDAESSVEEKCGPAQVHPEEGHKNDPRDGTPLLQGQTERVFSLEKRRLQVGLVAAFRYLKGSYKKEGTDPLTESIVIEQGYSTMESATVTAE